MTQQTLARAVEHHRAGELAQAEQYYREVLQREPQHPDALHLLGLIAHQRGQHQEAIDLINQALKKNNRDIHFYIHLGQAYRQAKRLEESVQAFKKALKLQPQNAEAHHEFGLALADSGKHEEALAEYERAMKLDPHNPFAPLNAGNSCHLLGDFERALPYYRQVLERAPQFAEGYNNLGSTLFQLGRIEEARPQIEKALELKPDYAEALVNHANILRQDHRFDAALACLDRALELKPDFLLALFNKANALAESGRHAESVPFYDQVLALQPDYPEALSNKAAVMGDLQHPEEAVELARQAVKKNPNFAEGYNNLGANLLQLGRIQDAFLAFQRAMSLKPSYESPYLNIAKLLWSVGDAPEAMRYLGLLLDMNPGHEEAKRCKLLFELYVYQEQPLPPRAPISFGAPSAKQRFAQRKDPHKKIRIGYISSDFRLHPVGRNIWPVLEGHDCGQFELYLYSAVHQPDALTERFKEIAGRYQSVLGMTDEQIADLIRRDEVDILVILAARFDNNKPLVAAYRAAPVQVSFHDPASSYLADMDYLITDITMNPPDTQEWFTEKLVRLPTFYLHLPLNDAPPTLPPPALGRGYTTFGCFNNVAKLNPQSVFIWSEVLKAVPDSRLVLKYKDMFNEPFVHAHYMDMFAHYGIPAERVQLLTEQLSFVEHLAAYRDIDIALDPFPFNGSTTTFEALWMGIPVVTLAGHSMVARWGASMLRRVGLSSLVAQLPGDYVQIAARLAADLPRLTAMRADLRNQVAQSPLCDHRRRAKQLDRVFKYMWRAWCAQD
ncbi:MAG: tetratricopeptide repeat protein [Burkholderiales bacterium]|nr:tetratricopeptide repeat protein [Burkholderiales bacterium]